MLRNRKPFTLRKFAIVIMLVIASYVVIYHIMIYQMTDGGLRECRVDLQTLGRAVASYYNESGTLPPQTINDSEGEPIHSWRGLIYEANNSRLRELPAWNRINTPPDYYLDEPWNGPRNSELIGNCPYIFRCPSDPSSIGNASYFCVSVDNTPFPSPTLSNNLTDAQRISRSIMKGEARANTILLLEKHNSNILWSEPKDLSIDEVTKQGHSNGLSTFAAHPSSLWTSYGSMAFFGDGRVEFLNSNIDPKILRSLLEVDNKDKPREPFHGPP